MEKPDAEVVTPHMLFAAINQLDLTGQVVCIHASLRSFGQVAGGAASVVQAFLDAGCTVLVPTFSYTYAIAPSPGLRPARNGWDYGYTGGPPVQNAGIFTPAAQEIDAEMGAIAAAALQHPAHIRGDHPLNSFSAVGPHARALIVEQQPLDVYAPLAALVDVEGVVLLMGVEVDKMTLLHHAEQVAGRTPLRRWANDSQGKPQMVETGGCSDGFPQLMPMLQSIRRTTMVGSSRWQLYPAAQTVQLAAAAIRAQPEITHCGRADCERCRDAIAGGPQLDAMM